MYIPSLLSYKGENTFYVYLFGRQKVICILYKSDHLKGQKNCKTALAHDPSDENSEGNINAYCQQVLNFLCCSTLNILPLEYILFNGAEISFFEVNGQKHKD